MGTTIARVGGKEEFTRRTDIDFIGGLVSHSTERPLHLSERQMIDLDRLELGGRNFIGARLTPPFSMLLSMTGALGFVLVEPNDYERQPKTALSKITRKDRSTLAELNFLPAKKARNVL
ncbi:hypothetical protein ALO78_101423 [Pseudomonas amygdali pv. ciccaronei]|nr:hypothetical protein ALO78_101423 [Pseudomonas amygdali pv. ciccaronei]